MTYPCSPTTPPTQDTPANPFRRIPAFAISGAGLILSVAVTFALYGPALRFSFFFDDAFDLTRTEQQSFWSLLSGALPGYGYYRPVPFMIWKALFLLTGRYDTVLLHLLPLASHALAGWLLFLLLRRLTGSAWAAVPALLFLLYPFSYQAVEIIGTVFHPLVTAEILAALVLWYDGRTRARPTLLALATVVAVLALWTHEFGAAVFPLLASLEALLWYQRGVGRPTGWLAAPLAAELAFLAIWFGLPKAGTQRVPAREVLLNGRLWLQGFAYPAAREVNWLAQHLGVRPTHLLAVVSVLGVAGALAAYARGHRLPLVLAAVVWGGLAFLPAVATLPYSYVEDGPRLLYVVAPGAAAFWGLLPMLHLGSRRISMAWRAATLAVLGVVAWQSVAFIQIRMDMLHWGTVIADGIIREGAAHDGGSLLAINVPTWFAAKSQEFPLGHLGVQLEPDYIGLDRLVYAGSLAHTRVESRSLAPDVSGWRYNFQPHGQPIDHDAVDRLLRAGYTLVVVDLYRETLAVREPGTLEPGRSLPASHAATFGAGLELLGSEVSRRGNLVTIVTRWYVDRPLSADYQLWTQLRTPDGTVVAERKDYALRGFSAPRLWRPGDLVEDRLVLDISGWRGRGPLSARLALDGTADGALLRVSGQGATGDGWVMLGGSAP